ncbi:MAG: hypothetical protein ABJA74_02260 [Lapillicoccus sp.]
MPGLDIQPVEDGQWSILAWLWQCFRHDLALVVGGLPYVDGRYQTRGLPERPSPDVAAYLGWRVHPKTGQLAPLGFAVVDGLITQSRRSIAALWVAPLVRSEGLGMDLGLDVTRRHDPPWAVAFQHDNDGAGRFWRRFADSAFGPGDWTEALREVPGVPGAPPDHWIETT